MENLYLSAIPQCRLCCSYGFYSVDIFSNFGKHGDLREKIFRCVGIWVRRSDKSTKACQKCVDKVNEFDQFRAICAATDNQMRYPSIDAVMNEAQPANAMAKVKYISLTDEETENENNNHEIGAVRSASARKRKVNGKRVKRTNKQFPIKCGAGPCAELFESRDAAMLHRTVYHVHGVMKCFFCYLCRKQFPSKQAIQLHMNAIHIGRRFKCPFPTCLSSFGQKNYVKIHVNTVHLKKLQFSCTKCPKKFYRNNHLRSHLAAKHGYRSLFRCNLCRKSLSTQRSLQRHMSTQHSDCSNGQFVPQASLD